MNSNQLIYNLKNYLTNKISVLAQDNPAIAFIKPIVSRAINNNVDKLKSSIDLLADSNGNIDVENIVSEMIESVVNSNNFNINAPFLGTVEIGSGNIKLNIPFTNKVLVLNTNDLNEFKNIILNN